MSVKKSLHENKDFILESLPTQELKDEFLKSLETVEDPAPPKMEELVAEATAPDHVSEDMYEAVKADVERDDSIKPLEGAELEAAIQENLKQVPTEPNESNEEE